MQGVTLETVRNVALVATVAAVVLALVLAFAVKAIVGKLLAVAVLVGVAAVVWGSRANVTECVDNLRAALEAGDDAPATCSFLGLQIDVPLP